jgi:hypothetical protein
MLQVPLAESNGTGVNEELIAKNLYGEELFFKYIKEQADEGWI